MPPASNFTPLMGLKQAATAPPAGPPPDSKGTDPGNPDYEGPDAGPFECDNCTFYQDPNVCTQPAIQASQQGVVDPGGCCKFFNSMNAAQSQPSQTAGQ